MIAGISTDDDVYTTNKSLVALSPRISAPRRSAEAETLRQSEQESLAEEARIAGKMFRPFRLVEQPPLVSGGAPEVARDEDGVAPKPSACR